jgi:hypothetical protein
MPIVTPVCRADELTISANIRSRNLFDARDQPELVISQIVPTLQLRVTLSLLTLDQCNSRPRFAAV